MGGPGASVLLREPLTKQQENELEIWLRSITNHLEKGKGAYEFWLNEDAFPGTVSRCLFYLSVEDTQQRWDEDEKRQIKESLGYLPTQSIDVSSGCNRNEDHTTLGQFVLHLAEHYDGLIDMGGAITPKLEPEDRERLDEISASVRAMPGSVYEIEYTTAAGPRWVYHIVDMAFLQAWMEHPRFYMIK
jgi:hypothetical protein